MKAKVLLCATLLSSASLFTSAALAEYELYSRDGTKLTFNAIWLWQGSSTTTHVR